MKLTHLISLIAIAAFFAGCASTESTTTTEAPVEAAPKVENTASAKTAYEGSTGSGLLMERYKSGAIEGYRD